MNKDETQQLNSASKGPQEPPMNFIQALQIFAMFCVTYGVIALWWAICMSAIETNFKGTVIAFIVIFVVYIAVIAILWNRGLKMRDQLIREYIENKIRENQQQ